MSKIIISNFIEKILLKIIYHLAAWYLKIRTFPSFLHLYFSILIWRLRRKIRSFRNIKWIREIRFWYKRKKWQIEYKKDLKKFNGDEKALEQYYNEKFLNVLEKFIKTSSSN